MLLVVSLAFGRQSVNVAPAGGTPVSRYFQSCTSSLRARATIPIRLCRLLPQPKRAWNQRLSSLSGWKCNQPQAISTAIHRIRLLPALLIPWSRSVWPLA